MTQEQLANKAGTSQSVIARMEDADYDGHSLKMLRRIAEALDCRLGLEFYNRPIPAEFSASIQSHEMAWPGQIQMQEFEFEFTLWSGTK